MTDHHPQTSHRAGPPPTPRQQRYLRQLALERGVSFVPPRTRARGLAPDRPAQAPPARAARPTAAARSAPCRTTSPAAAATPPACARFEISGYGSSATWKRGRVVTAPVSERTAPRADERARRARPLHDHRRRARDLRPAHPRRRAPGRRPRRRAAAAAIVIERELTSMAELEAIVADYLEQAARWDAIPAAGPCCLARPDLEARLR